MTTYHVPVPAQQEIAVRDAVTDDPAFELAPDGSRRPAVATWKMVVRATLLDDRVRQKLDVFEIFDLERKLVGADPGSRVIVTEKEQDAVRESLRRTTIHASVLVSGAIEWIRAWHDAGTEP